MTNSKSNFRIMMAVAACLIIALNQSCKKTSDDPAEVESTNSSNKNAAKTNSVMYLAANSNSAAFQSLVNQSVDGDIIILRTGSHYVTTPISLPIGKNGITIRGESGAVIRKAPNSFAAAAIEIRGNRNIIDLVELDGGNLPEAGIIIYGQRNTISNSKIHNCGTSAAKGAGILIHNTGSPVCAFNVVRGCSVYYNYMVGISQNGHSDGTIRDNRIYENGAEGLTIDLLSHNNLTENNTINDNNTANRGVGGIGTDQANGNRIINNTIRDTRFKSGLTFQNNIGGCDGTIVTGNHFYNNAMYGILQRQTQYQNTNTTISPNTYGGNVLGTTFIQN